MAGHPRGWRSTDARLALATEVRRSRHRLAIARHPAAGSGHADDPVFLVSAGRTGSQLLADYLNSLPGVCIRDEILSPSKVLGLPARLVTRRGVERHLRHSVRSLPGPVRGAKMLLSQLEDRALTAQRLRDLFPAVKFVVLYRRALGEQYVSLRMTRITGRYAARIGDDGPGMQVEISPDDLRRFYSRVKARYQRFLAPPWMVERSVTVRYEDLVADPQRIVGGTLCPFLGVEPTTVETTLVKQDRRPLSGIVSNYAEVGDLLTGDESRFDCP